MSLILRNCYRINLHFACMDFPIASSESLAGLRFATVGAKQTERCQMRIAHLYGIQNMPKGIFCTGCLVHCKLIICHIHLSDCPYTASASIVNARIDSFGFIVYVQSSFANVPVI